MNTTIETDQFKVCLSKSDETVLKVSRADNSNNTVVKVVCILALCGFFTTICTLAIVFGDYGPWVTIGLLAVSLHPSIRDRISGKHGAGRLEDRLTLLEMKLSETEKQLLDAQHQILVLEEGADFEKRIGVPANFQVGVATQETSVATQETSIENLETSEPLALTMGAGENPNS